MNDIDIEVANAAATEALSSMATTDNSYALGLIASDEALRTMEALERLGLFQNVGRRQGARWLLTQAGFRLVTGCYQLYPDKHELFFGRRPGLALRDSSRYQLLQKLEDESWIWKHWMPRSKRTKAMAAITFPVVLCDWRREGVLHNGCTASIILASLVRGSGQ